MTLYCVLKRKLLTPVVAIIPVLKFRVRHAILILDRPIKSGLYSVITYKITQK